jgi:hypothetical protein
LCFKCLDKAQKASNDAANKNQVQQEKAVKCIKLPNGLSIEPEIFSSGKFILQFFLLLFLIFIKNRIFKTKISSF